MEQVNRILRQLIAFPIIVYQLFIRPVMKPSCRFYPSCSQYAFTAIQSYGVFKGIKLACCRLLRCHPWCDGGYDPVLPNEEKH